MAAAFRRGLVFQLNAVSAHALEQPDSPPNIKRIAEPRIRINHERNFGPLADVGHGIRDFSQGRKAEIRPADARKRDTRPADVRCLEPGLLNHERSQRIENSRSNHGIVARQTGS